MTCRSNPTDSAGIVGLDVALALAERGYGKLITVVAEYLPGDTAAEYTSPWYAHDSPSPLGSSNRSHPNLSRAGCNFSAISGTDENALKWDKLGYAHLTKLASQQPDESFVQRTPSTELWDEKVPKDKIKHMSDYLEDASHQSSAEDGQLVHIR